MTRSFIVKLILGALLSLTIVGCAIDQQAVRQNVAKDAITNVSRLNSTRGKEITGAIATLLDQNGAVVGRAHLTSQPEGIKVKVTVAAINAEAGEHRLQLHQVGSCYPNFDAAGEPIQKTQQLASSKAANQQQILPPLELNQYGSAAYEAITQEITFSSGEMALFDADGSAIVLHEGSTNGTEQASKRLACGVIEVQLSSLSN